MANVTLEAANRICDAAVAKATEMGVKISVSVVDSGTNLVAMKRMDGSIMLGVEGSRGKAVASALFGQPSSELEELADRPVFRALMTQMGGRLIMAIGAVPIVRDGEVIGACGVGGATGEEDVECAKAGVSAL
ncbi:MAG: heme-binding protein [Chloroflexi bacterium]|nr:heme-binding protein [Chloroflexota bacterium]